MFPPALSVIWIVCPLTLWIVSMIGRPRERSWAQAVAVNAELTPIHEESLKEL